MEKLIINSKRLYIRNLKPKDLQDFYEYRSNPIVTKYQGFDTMKKQEAKRFIDDQTDKFYGVPGEWVQYGIENKKTGKLVGDCAIKLDDDNDLIAQIGITINPIFQNQGIAKEAMIAIMTWLFEVKKMHRISEIVDVENNNSIKLLEALGFKREGHFVENVFFNNKWGSEFQYALLAREWKESNQ